MRQPKPWFWEARDVWCVYINRQKYVLGPDKEAALTEFHNLMAKRRKLQRPSPKTSVLEAFLVWTKENRSEKTWRGYKDFCDSFRDYLAAEQPAVGIDDLSPEHVTAWLNSKPTWNSTTKRNAITALQRAFNWACRNMGLDKNPLKGMEKLRRGRGRRLSACGSGCRRARARRAGIAASCGSGRTRRSAY